MGRCCTPLSCIHVTRLRLEGRTKGQSVGDCRGSGHNCTSMARRNKIPSDLELQDMYTSDMKRNSRRCLRAFDRHSRLRRKSLRTPNTNIIGDIWHTARNWHGSYHILSLNDFWIRFSLSSCYFCPCPGPFGGTCLPVP